MAEQEGKAERPPENEIDEAPGEIETTTPSQTASMVVEPLQDLHTPHKRRRLILVIGVIGATMDLCCLPITYAIKPFAAAAWLFWKLTFGGLQILLRLQIRN